MIQKSKSLGAKYYEKNNNMWTCHYNSCHGTTFEVTEINGESIVSVGEKYEFPFVF